jgi:hypothetical protein
VPAKRSGRASGVPDDVRRFLRRTVCSAAELDAVLLMYGRPGREWSAAALAAWLGVDEEAAGRLLFELMARRVLRLHRFAPLAYVYDPPPELRRAVERLAELHATRPGALRALLAAPESRPARLLADYP